MLEDRTPAKEASGKCRVSCPAGCFGLVVGFRVEGLGFRMFEGVGFRVKVKGLIKL